MCPVTKPISALRNKATALAKICRDSGEPIYITKNGEGDLVLMSLAAYEQLRAELELYRMLEDAEADAVAGERGVSVATVRRCLKRSGRA